MTRAADILRERAAVAAGQGRTRDMAIIGAVADLMVVLAAQDKCPCCGMKYAKHEEWCVLAALERLIAGESDATSK